MNTKTILSIELERAGHELRHNTTLVYHDKLLKRYLTACRALSKHQEILSAQADIDTYVKEISNLDDADFDLPFEPSSVPDTEVLALCAEYGI